MLGALEQGSGFRHVGSRRNRKRCERVNCDPPSTRSSVPSTRRSSFTHSMRAARLTPRNVRMKQSATAALSRPSGDQTPPGPSNCGRGRRLDVWQLRRRNGDGPRRGSCGRDTVYVRIGVQEESPHCGGGWVGGCGSRSPISYQMAFSTPNASAKLSPRIQLKYHMCWLSCADQ